MNTASGIQNRGKMTTLDMVYIGIFAALIAICSWISIPTVVPFSLQTLGVFLACLVLGGRRGTLSVLVYILLGAVGLPVFTGFTGGPGRLLSLTGGYIVGFLFTALLYWALEKLVRSSIPLTFLTLLSGLFVCYALGTGWFMLVYSRTNGGISLLTTLGLCVFPFVIPDILKILLAMSLAPLIRRTVKI